MKITFLGGVEGVTGSRYLVENETAKILVDCGMFQGDSQERGRNWEPLPLEPSSLDAIILTHAHIDHTGYIPVMVKNGFKGKVYCSAATYDLCAILLTDSGALQEEDAREDKEQKEPLYTVQDAKQALKFFKIVEYNKEFNIDSLQVTLIPSHHILGASFVVVSDGKETLTFSGDLGRPNQLVMKDPTHLKETDFLVIESTYGDRLHGEGDSLEMLAGIIHKTMARGGKIIIPAFAVGRTQTILYALYQLKKNKDIPNIPIFLDSPMAISVTDLFCKYNNEHKLPTHSCGDVFDSVTYTRTVEQSKSIDYMQGPSIIIAGSGMATGGRVLHHFKHFIGNPKNTILFVGFQAEGTTGQKLVEGAKKIKIHGDTFEVRAAIETIDIFSAHADYSEILEWLGHFKASLKKVFVTHGEKEAADSLQKKIEERFGWSVVVPKFLESFDLD